MASANDRGSASSEQIAPVAASETSADPAEARAGRIPIPSGGPSESAGQAATAVPATISSKQSRPRSRKLWIAAAALLLLALAGYVLAPKLWLALDTVSTDDAYVNGHFTMVAPRIPGQVVRVLVDDNNRVRKGDLLVQLDKEPYQIQVQLKQAAVELAEADLLAAQDDARALLAQARSNRFKLENSIEQVDNQIALLRAKAAALETSRAQLARAKADFERAKGLQQTPGAISQQDVDLRQEEFRVGAAHVQQALEELHQVRVGLGLPAEPPEGHPLTEVPDDLNQNFSSVRQALADLLRSGAALGVVPSSYDAKPSEVIAEFYKRDPAGDLDRIFAKILPQVPAIHQAQAKLKQAQSDLDQAKLNLSYCDVFAEIDGVVTRRNVNSGNNVQAGQSLMVVRSLTEIWIDANFKETQLAKLRIGQRVDMKVDMYGRSEMFSGRITGFTMGTGSTLALLPAQNATGNFIKVVQRLPVRIEPVNYDPDSKPLFIGLSVVPYVFVNEPASGPHAGEFLQPAGSQAAPAPSPVGGQAQKP